MEDCEAILSEIIDLQESLQGATPGEKPKIIARIRKLQKEYSKCVSSHVKEIGRVASTLASHLSKMTASAMRMSVRKRK